MSITQPTSSQGTESTATLYCPSQDSDANDEVQVLNARPMRLFLCPKKIMKNLFTRRPKTSISKATWKNGKHSSWLVTWTPCNGSKSIQRYLYGSWSDKSLLDHPWCDEFRSDVRWAARANEAKSHGCNVYNDVLTVATSWLVPCILGKNTPAMRNQPARIGVTG